MRARVSTRVRAGEDADRCSLCVSICMCVLFFSACVCALSGADARVRVAYVPMCA